MDHVLNIEIVNNVAYLSGWYPKDLVKKVTSYLIPGARFSNAFKKGYWDGRKHLFDEKTSTMPAGLVTHVVAEIKKVYRRAHVNVIDRREESIPATADKGIDVKGKLAGKFGQGIYDYQMEAAQLVLAKKRGILKIATNGGKTSIAAAVMNHLCVPTLFVVPGVELLNQTLNTFEELLGVPREELGEIGDGEFRVGKWVTVAILDSLQSKLERGELDEHVDRWQALWLDECHIGGSETAYTALDRIPAYYRIGLSGTPLDRSDGAHLRLIAQTGEIIYEVRNKLLVERGISVQPLVKLMVVDEPKVPKKKGQVYNSIYDQCVVENAILNDKVAECAAAYVRDRKQVIVMVQRIKHGEDIVRRIEEKGVSEGKFIHGSVDSAVRQEALNQFAKGDYRFLVTTSILNQGIDLDCIDVLIFADGGKAVIPTLQRVGRGLRKGKGRESVTIVDIMNLCHPWTVKHSKKRLKVYKDEECFQISMIDE